MPDIPEPESYGGGYIVIRSYDPEWPSMFERERAAIELILSGYAVGIEHIGSTAVPGLSAKPIIDLLVGVHDLTEARAICLAGLEAHGYTYMAEYEAWLPGEMLFRKGAGGSWTHHVHVTEPTALSWRDYLLVRDYLRGHEEIACAYANLKTALALVFEDDIAGYRVAKRPFVERLLANALTEKGLSSSLE